MSNQYFILIFRLYRQNTHTWNRRLTSEAPRTGQRDLTITSSSVLVHRPAGRLGRNRHSGQMGQTGQTCNHRTDEVYGLVVSLTFVTKTKIYLLFSPFISGPRSDPFPVCLKVTVGSYRWRNGCTTTSRGRGNLTSRTSSLEGIRRLHDVTVGQDRKPPFLLKV